MHSFHVILEMHSGIILPANTMQCFHFDLNDVLSYCICHHNYDTHHLHQERGSTASSERPTVATKAKGQANNIMNAANSRRTGKSVTVITAICKRRS